MDRNISEVSFDDLDENVKHEIFRHLDKKSLLDCFEVCKDWYNFLNDNKKMIMKTGIKMNFPRDWKQLKQDLMKNSRNFDKMKIQIFDEDSDPSFIEVIRAVSQHVEVFELDCVVFRSRRSFIDLLTCFPSLKKLFISGLVTFYNNMDFDSIVQFPDLKLQKLVLKDMFGNIPIFTKLSLQSEKIIIEVESEAEFDDIANFLSIQQNLISLGLRCSEHEKELFESLTSKMSQITSIRDLSVLFYKDDVDLGDPGSWKSFVKFLDNMKNSLISLEIKAYDVDKSVFEKIINDMQLTRLYISATEITYDSLRFNQPNPHLKTLVMKIRKQDLIGDGKVWFNAFPNIQYLSLSYTRNNADQEISNTIANCLKSLKILRLPSNSNEIPNVCISSLSVLSIYVDYGNLDRMCFFLNVNPTIETLAIKSFVINHQLLDRITQSTQNLKNLIFYQHQIYINMEMLQMLSTNCPNLESFEVQTKIAQSNVKSYGKVHLTYHDFDSNYSIVDRIFTQDNSIWESDEDFSAIRNLDDSDDEDSTEDDDSMDEEDDDDDEFDDEEFLEIVPLDDDEEIVYLDDAENMDDDDDVYEMEDNV